MRHTDLFSVTGADSSLDSPPCGLYTTKVHMKSRLQPTTTHRENNIHAMPANSREPACGPSPRYPEVHSIQKPLCIHLGSRKLCLFRSLQHKPIAQMIMKVWPTPRYSGFWFNGKSNKQEYQACEERGRSLLSSWL
jgi:hypothetical protein